MATQLDLQEQEQLDALKAFWKRWGNLVTGVLVAVLLAYAGWNAWNWYQRDQGLKAGAMFDELERAAQAADRDKTARVFDDLRQRFGRTAFAQQGGLTLARVQSEGGQADAARATLAWVADNGPDAGLRTLAKLRLAGLLLDAKQHDEALKQLDGAKAEGFEGLVADRRGDVLLAQGQTDAARAAYEKAYKALEPTLDYRRLVEAKLTAMGAAPEPAASAPGARP